MTLATLLTVMLMVATVSNAAKKDRLEWNNYAQTRIMNSLHRVPNENVAKNVIVVIGDGMGLPSVVAGRILKGQLKGHTGEEEVLSFEQFPNAGLAKTYTVDRMVADSAGTATAYHCGVKANYETVGVDSSAIYSDCNSTFGAEVDCIVQWAQAEGKSTGFVTTARVTHASLAPLYAHSASRYWESDYDKPDNASACKDIASQLIQNTPGRNIQVILGGGRRAFLPNTITDPEYPDRTGRRVDGRDLTRDWLEGKSGTTARYVWEKAAFDAVDPDETDYLLGLFEPSHMRYELERESGTYTEPSLAEMTAKAIKILRKNPNGFYLFVESSNIDIAHHDSLAKHAIHGVLALDEAVITARHLVSEADTLLVVSADHSHVFSIGGYPYRGLPILGFAEIPSDKDDLPYTILTYGNGPGFKSNHTTPYGREDITHVATDANSYVQASAVPLTEETHGGEDVAVYAIGPMAHLLHGTFEQNLIAHVLGYAACIGENKDHCKAAAGTTPDGNNGWSVRPALLPIIFFQLLVFRMSV